MKGPSVECCQAIAARVGLVHSLQWMPSVDSTNTTLLARPDAPSGTVLVAEEQSAGRGRRGRSWQAPPGTSLLFSVLVRPRIPRRIWPMLTLAAGTAVLRACRTVTGVRDAKLKWPNDLLIGGRKAAGILVEAQDDRVVIGIGINTDWRGVDPPQGLTSLPSTSLAEGVDADVDRWELLEAVLGALDHELDLCSRDPHGVVRRYVGDCATLGTRVTAHGPRPITGTAVGLTLDGHLRIRTGDSGQEHVVTAGEVEHLR